MGASLRACLARQVSLNSYQQLGLPITLVLPQYYGLLVVAVYRAGYYPRATCTEVEPCVRVVGLHVQHAALVVGC
jgi:hypothetical protein